MRSPSTFARAISGMASSIGIVVMAACAAKGSADAPAGDPPPSTVLPMPEAAPSVDAAGDAAPDGPAGNKRCDVSDARACPEGFYCGETDCRVGRCLPLPLEVNAYHPVCGCDGVNYWNETVAASFLVGVKSADVCNGAFRCDNSNPCPLGQSCATQAYDRSQCHGNIQFGVCWGLPKTCPPTPLGVSCGGGTTQQPTCKPLCEAMRAPALGTTAEYALDPTLCPN